MAHGWQTARVMAQSMLEAEVAQGLGTKGRHQAPRRAQRRGDQGGYVVVAGRRVQIQRPRVRPVDGQEVALRTPGLQQPDRLDEAAFERMLYGVASRHDAGGSPGPRRPRDRRRREEHREGRLRPGHRGAPPAGFPAAPHYPDAGALPGCHRLRVAHAIPVALGVDAEGRKPVLGLREGTTENTAVTTLVREDLVARGRDPRPGLLVVSDGGTALAATVTRVFGDRVLIRRRPLLAAALEVYVHRLQDVTTPVS